MRFILIFLVLIPALNSFSQTKKYFVDCNWTEQKPERVIFSFPEVEPEFQGDLQRFYADSLKRPVDENGVLITGVVYVRVIVTENGELKDPWVLNSTNPILNEYALDFIRKMSA